MSPTPPAPRDRSQDPRDRITPYAFSVDPALLGLPLAPHSRRLGAMLLDLLLIAFLAAGVGGVVLGILAALFFLRLAFRPGGRGTVSAPGALARGTVGCLGAFVLFVVLVSLWGTMAGALWDRGRDEPASPGRMAERIVDEELGAVLGGIGEVERYREAGSPEEAAARARELADRLEGVGLDDEAIQEVLRELAPEEAEWRDAVREWEAALEDPEGDEAGDVAAPASPDDRAAVPEETPGAEVEGEDPGDTLVALQERLESEIEARRRAEAALRAAGDDEPVGLRAWLRSLAEDLGIGVGWAALYFAILTSWWNGRTPGKWLFGLRVVRLDGQRISWWAGFERYGGYAAGFATGLLGFAQVLWDPNRQATHDRIANTAVIVAGRPPLPVAPESGGGAAGREAAGSGDGMGSERGPAGGAPGAAPRNGEGSVEGGDAS